MVLATEVRTAAVQSGPAILKTREVGLLLKSCDRRTRKGRRTSCLLAVLMGGLRPCEAVRLTVENVELAPAGLVRLTVRCAKGKTGAPPRWRTVSLPPQAGRLVRAYIEVERPRFWLLAGQRGEHLSVRRAQEIVTAALKKIGRGDLKPYATRHTVGSQIVRATGSIYIASKVLGNSVGVCARYYAGFSTEDADRAADVLAAVWSPKKYKEARR